MMIAPLRRCREERSERAGRLLLHVVVWLFLLAGLLPLAAQEVSFLFASRAEAGNKPVGAVVAHFNTDGVLDLAVGNADSKNISILFGNPDGTFQLPFNQPVGATVVALAGADLDANGWIDLVVLTSSQIVVFRNNGIDPLLAVQKTSLGFTSAKALRVGNINGDSNPDVAVVNNSSFQILLGNGDGTFTAQAAVSMSTTIEPDTLALGDLNNDNFTDMVIHGRNGSGNGEVDVVLGNGDGTFVLPTLLRRREAETPFDSSGGDLAVADFDGNGKADVVSIRASVTGHVFLGQGDGTLQAPSGLDTTGRQLAVTDLNNDALLDLVIAQETLNDIAVMLGNGDGTFTEAEGYATGAAPVAVQLGDIDNDADKDFVAATQASVYSARGRGDGSFRAARNLFVLGAPAGAVLADFNGDGLPDLGVANADAPEVAIFLFQAGIRPGRPTRINVGTNPSNIAGGDFNNDGQTDLVTIHPGSNDIALLLGNGDGTFVAPKRFSTPDRPGSGLAVGDFNNDGNLDVVVEFGGDVFGVRFAVFLGDGTGGLQAGVTKSGGRIRFRPIRVGDFDRDGDLDLLGGTTDVFGRDLQLRLFPGLGNGDFDSSRTLLNEDGTVLGGLALGDFNGDGVLDVAVTSSSASHLVRVLQGNGDLTFTSGFLKQLSASPREVLAVDVNGDGPQDLVLTQVTSGAVPLGTLSLLLGNGDGTFREDASLPGLGGKPANLVEGDLNQDGKTDVLTLNATGRTATLLINTSPNPVPTLAALSPSAAPPGSLDFTLTVEGGSFVAASVVRWNGADRTTTFVNNMKLLAAIPASDVTTAGTATVTVFNPGPGGGTSTVLTFTISSDNPVPVVSSLSPATTAAGAADLTLTVTGRDFVSNSVVRWNGADRATTFVSNTELQATILASDLTTGTTVEVTVFTPTPGGGTSNFSTFTINNVVPTLNSISPTSSPAGESEFTLTATGLDLVSTSVVRWNGSDRATIFISSTELQATILASDIATEGTAQVTVFNPAPGGGTSSAKSFRIGAPRPPNDDFARAFVIATTPFTDTVDASNATTETTDPTPSCGLGRRNNSVWYQFTPSSNGTVTADTFGSNYDTVLSAWTGSPGSFSQVACNDQAGGTSQSEVSFEATAGTVYSFMASAFSSFSVGNLTFSLDFAASANPVPSLSSLSPASATVGGTDFDLTVTGSDFVSTSVVRWNGADRTTTFVSSSELTASIPATDIVAAGTAQVTVFNPSPGGGTSAALTFTISTDNPVPTLTSMSPATAMAGGADFALTVNGSDFLTDSLVRWNGSDRTTTFVSSSQLQAAIPASDIAVAGTAEITVLNPTPGGGISNVLTFSINLPPPVVNPGGTVNGASFNNQPPAASSIGSLFGTGLASAIDFASAVPLPTTLAGARVQLNGIDAPLFFASPLQINFQFPNELQGLSEASISVTLDGVTSNAETIPLASFGPGLFATNQAGSGQGAILISGTGGAVAAPTGTFPGSRPVMAGEFIEIFCTGLGAVTNQPATGAAASSSPLSETTTMPTVTIGGVAATVSFSGLAPGFVGLYQVNVEVPANVPTGDAVDVVLTIGGSGQQSLDGTWSGTTGQGKEVSLTVENEAIPTVTVGFIVGPCSGTITVTFGTPQPITNNSFSITVSSTAPGGISFTMTGTFASATSASGSLNFTGNAGSGSIPGCSGTATTGWNANKGGAATANTVTIAVQ